MRFKSEDLPEPNCPAEQRIPPRGTSRETPSTARIKGIAHDDNADTDFSLRIAIGSALEDTAGIVAIVYRMSLEAP